jgi:hypothetical protein
MVGEKLMNGSTKKLHTRKTIFSEFKISRGILINNMNNESKF